MGNKKKKNIYNSPDEINKYMSLCRKNGITIFPVNVGNKLKVRVNNNGRKHTWKDEFDQTADQEELNNEIIKRYIQYGKKVEKELANDNSKKAV